MTASDSRSERLLRERLEQQAVNLARTLELKALRLAKEEMERSSAAKPPARKKAAEGAG